MTRYRVGAEEQGEWVSSTLVMRLKDLYFILKIKRAFGMCLTG
jgi:hypothetical protein